MSADYLAGVFNAKQFSPTAIGLRQVPTLLRNEKLYDDSKVLGKPVLDFEGKKSLAELILLRLLEREGWQGCWVNNYRRAFWRDIYVTTELPEAPSTALFYRVVAQNGGKAGCWDIFAWRGGEVLFVESKQRGKDRIQPTQQKWLESALAEGVPLSSFYIVEYQKD